jgi:hypothetical protein
MKSEFSLLRSDYHKNIFDKIIRVKVDKKGVTEYPNNADIGNTGSVKIAFGIVDKIGEKPKRGKLDGQTAGDRFEILTKEFLEKSFRKLSHVRPGEWNYSIKNKITNFDQYKDLAELDKIIEANKELAAILGKDYIIQPDIVIGRSPISDKQINKTNKLIQKSDKIAQFTPLRTNNQLIALQILHASISCKWTIRSDRVQNSRTEALNLIRNRKGNLPHIVAVTAEPLPTRISSLALGTGDLDCIYHFALNELIEVVEKIGNDDQKESLATLVNGRRLRDISDLPFDLAI